MVSAQQQGRFVMYSANFETMNSLISYLTENCCGGNPCNPISNCLPELASSSE
jgi:hypothetical protein